MKTERNAEQMLIGMRHDLMLGHLCVMQLERDEDDLKSKLALVEGLKSNLQSLTPAIYDYEQWLKNTINAEDLEDEDEEDDGKAFRVEEEEHRRAFYSDVI